MPARRSPAALLAAAFEALLDLLRWILAPPRCAACDAPCPPRDPFCGPCGASIEPAPPPWSAEGPLRSAPEDHAAAAYGGALAAAVKRFKYGGRPDLALPLGALLRAFVRRSRLRADVVVPVPLHPRKLRDRGYNQAALVASAAASELRVPLATRALSRRLDTVAQASLDGAARRANLAGAFRVRSLPPIRGRHVLLVDDVATTGSTLDACRAALLEAGASRVSTLVLARAAPRGSREPAPAPLRAASGSAR